MKWVMEATQAKYKQSVAVVHNMTNSKKERDERMSSRITKQALSDHRALKRVFKLLLIIKQ